MYCINCGAQHAEGARFCDRCGTPVAQQAGQPTAAQAAGGQAAAPAWAQPVYPCFFYPVNAVPVAPAAPTAPAASVPDEEPAGPIYRRARPAHSAAERFANRIGIEFEYEDEDEAFEEEAVEPVPEPSCESDVCPLSVWHTLLCYLALFCLPIGNIIFACVWGFREDEHPQRRNMARAALPLIALTLLVLFTVLLWVAGNLDSISFTLR